MLQLLKLAESLRSQLSKTALVTIQECFQSLRRKLDSEIDHCALVLFKKAADTNLFIAEAAKRTVEAMPLLANESTVIQALISNCDSRAASIR